MVKSLKQGLHLLETIGRRALQPYMKQDHRGKFRYYPPAIPRSLAAIIRNHYLTHGQYCQLCCEQFGWKEVAVVQGLGHVYPGLKHDLPPVPRQKHEKARQAREERLERIRENMKDMDRKIAEYRESLKIKNVSLLDQLTMRKKQIRMKYTRTQQ